MNPVTPLLSSFAAQADYGSLPEALVNETKFLLLDTIGCAIAGGAVDKGAIAVSLARRLGGAEEATMFGHAGRVSPANAAFANGELINALDWDPIPHTLPCVVAPCLALAESQRASGRDVILGIALGNEISARLAEALPGDLEPQPHGYGSCVFGAVAGAGRILKLDGPAMAHAFGVAGFAAPIPAMTRFEGGMSPIPMTKYLSLGWLAQTAVTSALLAQLGYTGDTGILDGPQGFWRLFGGTEAKWQPGRVTEALGTSWRAGKPWYKPYPCEVLIGVALNRLREIMRENALAPGDIEGVDFRSIPVLATPCHTTMEIATHVDAQFSVPYVLAAAALGIEPGPAWQAESTMRDPAIAEFMRKVTVGVHREEEARPGSARQAASVGHIPCHLEVRAHGRRFTIERTEAFMTQSEIVAKFEKNALTRLPPSQVDRARQTILELEELEDVSALTSCLVP